MRVKIGDNIYDSEKEPIMVILSDSDKKNITNMLPHCTKYASFPEEFKEDIERWMDTE